MTDEIPDEVKRWTVKRRQALILQLIRGETTTAEAARKYGLTVREVEEWREKAMAAIDTKSNTVLGAVDTPQAVPHNIALTARGEKLYVTHSGGASTTVSVYTAGNRMPVPVLLTEVTVGLNPFGIAFVP